MAVRYAIYVGTPLSGSLFDPIPTDQAGSSDSFTRAWVAHAVAVDVAGVADSTSVDHTVGGGGLGNVALGTAPLGD